MKTNQNPPSSSFPAGNTCITSGIQNPGTFCTSVKMDNKYANLWSADNTVYTANDNNIVKTIYDPCPVGYQMPPSNAFTGFTTTGQGTTTSSRFNVRGTFNKGWNFYCGLNKTGDTVFFPASGWRHGSSAVLNHVGTYGFYWSAVPRDVYYGRSLYFSLRYMLPLYRDNGRGFGFEVRPCQE